MKKYQPQMYLENLEKDKVIKDNWIKSLKSAAPAAPAASSGE
jgi:hypothetical protein